MNDLYEIEIGCKTCLSRDCRGCNMFILNKALEKGCFNSCMNANKQIDLDILVEVLRNGHNN